MVIGFAQVSIRMVILLIVMVMFSSGNAVTTCKSNDTVKVFTIRGTAFEAASASGGAAASESGRNLHCTCIVSHASGV